MERHKFVQEHPDIALQQEKEWWNSVLRIIWLVTFWVSSISFVHTYAHDEEFRSDVSDTIDAVWRGYIGIITDIENPGTLRDKK
jgi:hypothetical protein